MRKILVSPGYGAGWVSWESDIRWKRLMIDWPPLIAALEEKAAANGSAYASGIAEDHPAVLSLLEEGERLGLEGSPYLEGLSDLEIAYVNGRVRITEYDGSESWEEEDTFNEWL